MLALCFHQHHHHHHYLRQQQSPIFCGSWTWQCQDVELHQDSRREYTLSEEAISQVYHVLLVNILFFYIFTVSPTSCSISSLNCWLLNGSFFLFRVCLSAWRSPAPADDEGWWRHSKLFITLIEIFLFFLSIASSQEQQSTLKVKKVDFSPALTVAHTDTLSRRFQVPLLLTPLHCYHFSFFFAHLLMPVLLISSSNSLTFSVLFYIVLFYSVIQRLANRLSHFCVLLR